MGNEKDRFQKTILISGYLCDPFDVSEGKLTFEWLKILLKQFNLILLTTTEAEKSINLYYDKGLPANLKIISFTDNYPFKSTRFIRNTLMPGYFLFNYKIRNYLNKNPDIIEQTDIIYHRSPESFRYYTSLTRFSKPVYIGPLFGGLKPHPALKHYFKAEAWLYKLRNIDPFILKLPVYKRQFAKVNKVLISYDYMKDILPAEYLLRKKILLNVGIHTDDYQQANSNYATFKILYVGRLTRYKGCELLIKALKDINRPNIILDILGRGEEREHLERLVKEYGLTDKVVFHGQKAVADVKQFYRSASVFCLPTLKEASGNVFFEAMASGLPIITIDNGGPKYICPEEGAIKIPISSEEQIIRDIRQSIILLMDNPEKCIEMGKFNRVYCKENYDWKVLEKNILKFFNEEMLSLD